MKETNPSQVPGTYYFLNLGCPKNLVDAERTAARLEVAGWKGVLSPEDAEIVVVTTCAFISEAEEESVDEILSAASRKREGQKLVVLGCLVSREGGALPELFPEVDLFLGVDEMESLPERLMDLKSEVQPEKRSPAAASGRKLFTPPHIAYLRIADGCSNHCSFCTIPSIRGELRSCDRKEILDEAEGLVDAGVRELVVIAQDTGAWGLERKGGERLCSLLEDLSKTAGATWIRLMYLHPAHIDLDRLLRLLESGIICRYLDLP
ncbi:MAG: 30S ribosomal protein S12 methylthiotransferase RimO, partial [Candidatus Krumholzibacteria bacterium]|nr:30S ribosomal protein S12 methylthiotransferase RimO [Candidatus Krumholzibacteria bacterium]